MTAGRYEGATGEKAVPFPKADGHAPSFEEAKTQFKTNYSIWKGLIRRKIKMPTPRRWRGPKPDRRRALELLAFCPEGCTEAIMLAHGFTVGQLDELVRAGFATAQTESVVAGSRTFEVARVRITKAGRMTLRGR
jgi:hypothetical protein